MPLVKIAVHSNLSRVEQGGGGVFILAIASVLAETHDVDLWLQAAIEPEALRKQFPAISGQPRLCVTDNRPDRRILSELRQAWTDRRYDAILVQSPRVPRLTLNRNAMLLCEFPFTRHLSWRERLRLCSYRTILANSAYTAKWIQRRWGYAAQVLHPPVAPIPAQEKRPWILAVGRFMGGARSKRQLEMVEQFRRLRDAGVSGWELHLAGFVENTEYFEQVRQAAQGQPICFHPNICRTKLEELYGVSSIFWHAVGEGVDPEAHPEVMEHFGIVTVEAMSAGCVPVVINRGGQPEILGADKQAGRLWTNRNGWHDATLELISSPAGLQALATAAQQRAKLFDVANFHQRLQAVWPIVA